LKLIWYLLCFRWNSYTAMARSPEPGIVVRHISAGLSALQYQKVTVSTIVRFPYFHNV
jgi:hypothetical protein